ncbi:phosphohistidine phosphatase SixA [Shewanella sp. WXL01]|uniref:Phosphohistidine phosphatase SixA n=1 Tax=Shewanella maritima TaxID=2520507 RepID=A0A411PKP7_9GAMM|nr:MULTISPECIES: phosphohistidine phosphatase SixA [Shewanella]NKF51151.1 phosphohistidine phosphatase SixA [Shewanella sp. WXL01]QBF84100.1 phosphohistidine phosphatase SixA [Shewanella maritima]
MQLFLMRHGEAGFDAPSDRERKLTDTGRYQTRLMANWLSKHADQFELVIVSPYLRAQQTWQEVSKSLPEPGHFVTLDDVTPNADPSYGVDAIKAYAEQFGAEKVLVISHMPIVGFMVHEFDTSIEPPIFATSAIAKIDSQGEVANFEGMYTPQNVA